MRPSSFDFISNLDTIIAVVIGAVLATGGALIAEIWQDKLGRGRRERDAARFFGEIVSSAGQIFDLACRSQTIGERWGPVTLNFYKVALREAAIYERNRERLFDLQDMELRFALHGHVLRFTVAIESCIDLSEEIEEAEARVSSSDGVSDAERDKLKEQIEALRARREASLDAAEARREVAPEMLSQLEQIAGARFSVTYE